MKRRDGVGRRRLKTRLESNTEATVRNSVCVRPRECESRVSCGEPEETRRTRETHVSGKLPETGYLPF